LRANSPCGNTFNYFEPSEKFKQKYPSIHIPLQTCTTATNDHFDVMVINHLNIPQRLKRSTKIGSMKSELKTNAVIQPISDFISSDSPLDSPSEFPSLNHVVAATHATTLSPDESFLDCHTMSTFHDHKLSPEELKDRNSTFKNQGFFQKSITETLEDSNNIPEFEYTGADQFIPKTDEELLKDCDLSHLSPEHRELTTNMLKKNIQAFQRHPLDIGN
jgi:hypothetical protein